MIRMDGTARWKHALGLSVYTKHVYSIHKMFNMGVKLTYMYLKAASVGLLLLTGSEIKD